MAKIFLLNADTVIFMIRGLKPATRQQTVRDRAARIVSRCQAAQAGGDVVGLSAITVSELEFGARHSDRYGEEIAAVQKILQPFELFDYNAVECAARYGEVRLTLSAPEFRSGPWIY